MVLILKLSKSFSNKSVLIFGAKASSEFTTCARLRDFVYQTFSTCWLIGHMSEQPRVLESQLVSAGWLLSYLMLSHPLTHFPIVLTFNGN